MVSSIWSNESTTTSTSTSSSLPSWLQQYKEQNRRQTLINDQEYVHVRDLCKKWNSLSSSAHKHPHFSDKTFNFSSSFPSSTSFLSYDHRTNSTPNSATSSEAMEDMEGFHRFKELNAENLKILCDALERKVPWQRGIVREIVVTILQCRSGMMKRKGKLKCREEKEETSLFLGAESEGKEKIAREIARLVFGSRSKFISIGLSNYSLTRADSTDDFWKQKNKR